ncbi:hypothetical protein DL93DRAFT_2165636 [Clavulina sp. PMI_390]|nr:hypothetical protein DL93DRAFT_2165636 [Clavulina sp. PMI_390]
MATSPDFQNWTLKSDYDALPTVANWSTGVVWAPDVVQLHYIGPASSSTAEGPFVPFGTPICNITQGGSIDPAGFQDYDGRQYVVWKIDGSSIGKGGDCGNDGWSPIGPQVQLLDKDDSDGPLIEAPSLTMVKDPSAAGGYLYMLFYSSHCYNSGDYDSKYATSVNGIRGPYTKASASLLSTGIDGMCSPGGLDVGPDASRVMFHADQGTSANTRLVRTGTISIDVTSRTVSI